jgi:hypothetical protein
MIDGVSRESHQIPDTSAAHWFEFPIPNRCSPRFTERERSTNFSLPDLCLLISQCARLLLSTHPCEAADRDESSMKRILSLK